MPAVSNICQTTTLSTSFKSGAPQSRKMTGIDTLPFEKGGNGGGGAFFITVSWVISWFIMIDLKQIYCSYSRNKKIQNGFL